MVEYPKDPAEHKSQVDVAKSYIEKGAEKHADKYKILDKLDQGSVGKITSNVGNPFKIKDYGATSFTDAVARHFYGDTEGYKGLTHEQRNVVLNVYLALASQGLDLNVCHPSDEWKFDLEAGTFEATLDGKKVSGKLEYLKRKEDREKVIRETKGALASLKNRITAEAQNILASEPHSTVERTTEARKAIEIGSLSNLMATLGNMDATGFQERKALLSKELMEGATKDQLVDDTIAGINHYLEIAGQDAQKINPETGQGYKGTAEQNKAWIAFIKDVLGKEVPDYLKSEPASEPAPEKSVSPEPEVSTVPKVAEVVPFEFEFIENGPKPQKGIEERKQLKDFLKAHFKEVSEEVEGMTYGSQVEITWSEEGGKRFLEVKWKEIKGKDQPAQNLMDKSRKVAVDAGGIFHGWGKSWKELEKSMENAMTMPDNLTTAPAGEIWTPIQSAEAEAPVRRRAELPIHKESTEEDGIATIGELEGVGGSPGGTLPPREPVRLREPELAPTPKLEEKSREEIEPEHITFGPEPLEDHDLPVETQLGNPFPPIQERKEQFSMGKIVRGKKTPPKIVPGRTSEEIWDTKKEKPSEEAAPSPEVPTQFISELEQALLMEALEITGSDIDAHATHKVKEGRVEVVIYLKDHRGNGLGNLDISIKYAPEVDVDVKAKSAITLMKKDIEEMVENYRRSQASTSAEAPPEPEVKLDKIPAQLAALKDPGKPDENGFTVEGVKMNFDQMNETGGVFHGKTAEGYPITLTLKGEIVEARFYILGANDTAELQISTGQDVQPMIVAAKYASTRLEKAHIDPKTMKVPPQLKRQAERMEEKTSKDEKQRFQNLGADPEKPEAEFRLGGFTMEYVAKASVDGLTVYQVKSIPSMIKVGVRRGNLDGKSPYEFSYEDPYNQWRAKRVDIEDKDRLLDAMNKARKEQMDNGK